MRSMPMAMSSSSGCTSCGCVASALAGEPSNIPASGLMYQDSSAAATQGQSCTRNPDGGANMKAERRLGTRPIGRTPANCATASHHAPAALISTGAWKSRPAVCTDQSLAERRCRDAGIRVHLATLTTQALQIALVQGVQIDVGCIGLKGCAEQMFARSTGTMASAAACSGALPKARSIRRCGRFIQQPACPAWRPSWRRVD